MQGIDAKQQKTINLIIAGVGIITAFIGIMAYRDNKKHQKVQQDLFAIDREIKLLQLAREKDLRKTEV
jgi:hypothetical protein